MGSGEVKWGGGCGGGVGVDGGDEGVCACAVLVMIVLRYSRVIDRKGSVNQSKYSNRAPEQSCVKRCKLISVVSRPFSTSSPVFPES